MCKTHATQESNVFTIEKNIPYTPEKAEAKRTGYLVFNEMEVGDSFEVDGEQHDITKFRRTMRNRNMRSKTGVRFEWVWTGKNKIRVWRIK